MQESDADWTILCARWFAQNFSESFLLAKDFADSVRDTATIGVWGTQR